MRRVRSTSVTDTRVRPLLLASLLVAGCAHKAVVPPPVTVWRELRSTHFRLRTDLPEGSARTTLEKLESLRWWLQAAWSPGGDVEAQRAIDVLPDDPAPADLRALVQERERITGACQPATRPSPARRRRSAGPGGQRDDHGRSSPRRPVAFRPACARPSSPRC